MNTSGSPKIATLGVRIVTGRRLLGSPSVSAVVVADRASARPLVRVLLSRRRPRPRPLRIGGAASCTRRHHLASLGPSRRCMHGRRMHAPRSRPAPPRHSLRAATTTGLPCRGRLGSAVACQAGHVAFPQPSVALAAPPRLPRPSSAIAVAARPPPASRYRRRRCMHAAPRPRAPPRPARDTAGQRRAAVLTPLLRHCSASASCPWRLDAVLRAATDPRLHWAATSVPLQHLVLLGPPLPRLGVAPLHVRSASASPCRAAAPSAAAPPALPPRLRLLLAPAEPDPAITEPRLRRPPPGRLARWPLAVQRAIPPRTPPLLLPAGAGIQALPLPSLSKVLERPYK